MRRRIFSFVSAVSLLLCLGTVVLWVWGHWGFVRIGFSPSFTPERYTEVVTVSEGGGIAVLFIESTRRRQWSHLDIAFITREGPIHYLGGDKEHWGFDARIIR